MGRGTTPLQAALQRRRPIGNDINPLSTLLARPRLAPPSLAAIEARLGEIDWSGENWSAAIFSHFIMRTRCASFARCGAFLTHSEPVDDWIKMVAINRLTGRSPGFFSVYTLPPNQAVSVEAQVKINARRGQRPPPRDVARLILKKSRALLADGPPPPHPPATFGDGDAAHTPFVASAFRG